MDLKLKTKLEMFRNTEHENFYNGSSKGMGTISSNTADEMYELINELERALIKAETSQDEALNLAVVSGSYSDADVRNIALEMKNEAVSGLYGEQRWSMQERLGNIQDKWKLRL